MDGDGLAQSAVEVVAQHLAQRGTDAVGRLADAGVDHIYQLIVSRLQRNPAGQGMLSWFHQNPADEQSRRRFAAVVADEVRHDPGFAESLGRAAERAGVFVQGAGASQQIIENRGDFRDISAGRDVRIKQRQFHIGRFQVGTGGLVTGVIGYEGEPLAPCGRLSARRCLSGHVISERITIRRRRETPRTL